MRGIHYAAATTIRSRQILRWFFYRNAGAETQLLSGGTNGHLRVFHVFIGFGVQVAVHAGAGLLIAGQVVRAGAAIAPAAVVAADPAHAIGLARAANAVIGAGLPEAARAAGPPAAICAALLVQTVSHTDCFAVE